MQSFSVVSVLSVPSFDVTFEIMSRSNCLKILVLFCLIEVGECFDVLVEVFSAVPILKAM